MPDLFDAVDGPTSDALLSPCGLYRYSLTRCWDDSKPRVCWVMLNPSTSDANQDDPTIRRVKAFSRAWGCGSLVVVNLFALRATDPAELSRAADPVGLDNDAAILRHGGTVLVVVAWGAHPFAVPRARQILDMLAIAGARIHCLELTRDGHPRHPLYVKGDRKPVEYRP